MTRMSFCSESNGFPVVLRLKEVVAPPYQVVFGGFWGMRRRAISIVAVMVFFPVCWFIVD